MASDLFGQPATTSPVIGPHALSTANSSDSEHGLSHDAALSQVLETLGQSGEGHDAVQRHTDLTLALILQQYLVRDALSRRGEGLAADQGSRIRRHGAEGLSGTGVGASRR